MKFWCNEDNQIVEADSFEANDKGEASPHNGVGEHTHCDICSGNLSLRDCRDIDYIQRRIKVNKTKLDKYGAQQVIPGRKLQFHPIERLAEAQDEKKTLLYAQSETLKLQHEGAL